MINGETYDSFDKIPEEYKKDLDMDGNGKFDLIESAEFIEFSEDGDGDESSRTDENDEMTRVVYKADESDGPTFKNEGVFGFSATFELKDKIEVEMWKLILFGLVMFGIGAYVAYHGVL
jgi:hypothetical protein